MQSTLFKLINDKKFYINEHFFFFFKQIYGIGFLRSRKLTLILGSNKNFNLKLKHIKNDNYIFLRIQKKLVRLKYNIGDKLKNRRKLHFFYLLDFKTYKGIRYYYGLPLRGQRTHTNASTSKRIKIK